MRKHLTVVALVCAAVLASVAVAAEPEPPSATTAPATASPPSYAATRGCSHSHPSRVAYRTTSRILRSSAPLTSKRWRRAHHYVVCVATVAKHRAVQAHVRRLMTWRRSYAGYWTILRGRLSAGTVAMLRRLGPGCETRGMSDATGYAYDGHHDGRYQYDGPTWRSAQWWVAARYRTALAHRSSAAHQDVVTARFFPSHRSQWACSA